MSTTAVVLALLALAIPALLCCAYLLVLTLLSARLPLPRRTRRPLRFAIVVPAHDEEAMIARTVGELSLLDWPREDFRVIVVADNCGDATAERAAQAGARVLERRDDSLRGKGYALRHAFDACLSEGWADAIVVIDADTEASPNLLQAMAARLAAGATAVQAHYAVANPQESWRTRLMAIAMAAFHSVRSRARERLGLSSGIRGNGWCVTPELLAQCPYNAYTLAEDLEYGIDLGLAGHRVHYAEEAEVRAAMVSGEANARSQRQRWEGGRLQQLRLRTGPLLRAAWHQRSAVCLDLALDLLVPPLAWIAALVTLLLAATALATAWQPGLWPWLAVAGACAAVLVAYVLRGWWLSGVGLRGLADLLRAPWFIAWKLMAVLRRPRRQAWVRTGRELP